MKTTLTIEESAKLIELGVDPKLASMVSWIQTEDWQRKSVLGDKEHLTLKPFTPMLMGFERFDCKDVFTLTDIISILPKKITDNGKTEELNIILNNDRAFVGYPYIQEALGVAIVESELIDALYQLLIWVIENNHLNHTER